MSDAVQITFTAGSEPEARRIADALVDKRLAACVQISGPVRSIYSWKGELNRDEEWLCHVKTAEARCDACMAMISEMHSYDVPEIIATKIVAGSSDYIKWVLDQTTSGDI